MIDTSPPIKSGYPPYAVLKQRAIAIEYGEPKLVSLPEAEKEYLKIKAAIEGEAPTSVVEIEEAGPSTENRVSQTIDGGVNYGAESGNTGTVKIKKRESKIVRMTLPAVQPVLWSDQGVETELMKEVIESERPEVRAVTNDGVGIAVSQLAANVVNAALPATAQHDSVR